MHKKKVAIVSGVGIPANYSGYETLIENIAEQTSQKFDLYVYCSSKAYTTKLETYKGAKLIYLDFKANGIQSIIYDCVSVLNAIFIQKINTILILGVGIGMFIPIFRLISPKTKFIVHLDGLEWKRTKWNKFVRFYLKVNEWFAGKFANEIIADNIGIQEYVKQKYRRESNLIQYGANIEASSVSINILKKYTLPDKFDLSICRIVPENNIKLILKSYVKSNAKIVFIGNWKDSSFALDLFNEYKNDKNIFLIDKIFDQEILASFKNKAQRYIHGHSVGGTNPSLIEAMYHKLPIIAFDVNFNRHTTFGKAFYFKNELDLLSILNSDEQNSLTKQGDELFDLAINKYNWKTVSDKYIKVFDEL